MLCDDLDGWDEGRGGREVQEGGDICLHVVGSLHCTAESNTMLGGNHILIKKIAQFKLKRSSLRVNFFFFF